MNNKLFIGTLLIISMHNAYCMNEDSNPSQPHTVSEDEEFNAMSLALFDALQQGGPNRLQNALQALNSHEMSNTIDQSCKQNISTIIKEQIEKEEEEQKKFLESKLKELKSKRYNKQY